MGFYLEVTTHPEFTTEELAFQLAEAMQGVVTYKQDADSFSNQMQIENRKIAELEFTIRQVEAFQKNPPAKVSRMEPLATYDIAKLEEEIQIAKEARAKWAKLAEEALAKVSECKAEQGRIQGELNERKSTK